MNFSNFKRQVLALLRTNHNKTCMKKTFFFVAVTLFYSCSKQAPAFILPDPANPSPACDSCKIPDYNGQQAIQAVAIKSSDWETDGSGGIRKDLLPLIYNPGPWDYAEPPKVLDVVLNYGGGINQRVIRQGGSLDYFGGVLSLNGTVIQFSGAVGLLPVPLKLDIVSQ